MQCNKTVDDFSGLLAWTEPCELNPDLEECISKKRSGLLFLEHPFIHEPYVPHLNKKYNTVFEQKQKMYEEHVEKGEFYEALMYIVEKPHRFQALDDLAPHMNRDMLMKCIASVWILSENIHQFRDEWEELWNQTTEDDHALLMKKEELEAFNNLPDMVTVYRGCREGLNENGLSWTLREENATWFANRYGNLEFVPLVLRREIKKSDIKALFLGRNEFEVVYVPE